MRCGFPNLSLVVLDRCKGLSLHRVGVEYAIKVIDFVLKDASILTVSFNNLRISICV